MLVARRPKMKRPIKKQVNTVFSFLEFLYQKTRRERDSTKKLNNHDDDVED